MTAPLELLVVRLPHPLMTAPRGEEKFKIPSLSFPVVRRSHELPGNLPDEDTGADIGWRHGVLILPPDHGSSTFVVRIDALCGLQCCRIRVGLMSHNALIFEHFAEHRVSNLGVQSRI
jgi:hypothetical protein